MSHTASNSHLSWDSVLLLLFLSFVYYVIGRCSSNGLYSMLYIGCAMGILQCLIIHEGGLYVIYFMEHGFDLNRVFGPIQLAPYMPQMISGSDTDDSGNEKED